MKFVGHRGYSKLFPENSYQAFDAVVNYPLNGSVVWGIELDLQLTKNGVIPVMHNTFLNDTDNKKVKVCDISFRKMQKLFSLKQNDKNLKIPILKKVFKLINHKTNLCLEIKKGDYDLNRFIKKFMKYLKKYKPNGDIIISSFSVRIMEEIIKATFGMNLKYGFLFEHIEDLETLPENVFKSIHYLHPEYIVLLKEWDKIYKYGLPINTWVVNDLDTVEKIQRRDKSNLIYSIMTDNLDLSKSFT